VIFHIVEDLSEADYERYEEAYKTLDGTNSSMTAGFTRPNRIS
jgi:hypothetical protein